MLFVERILCPVDGSEASLSALDTAVDWAKRFGSDLTVLHVLPPLPIGPELYPMGFVVDVNEEEELRDEALKQLHLWTQDKIPVDIVTEYEVRQGDAANEILEAAATGKADLILLSTHGRTGWRHMLFGSVAEAVVREAKCPVLTVHPCGTASAAAGTPASRHHEAT